MTYGNLCISVSDGLEYLSGLVKSAEYLKNFRILDINGAAFGNTGAGIVQEVAFSLAMGSEYLATLGEQGIAPSEPVRSLQFSLAIGPHYFMEIAKLRAFRVLWSRVCLAYGLDETLSRTWIHASTSRWNMSLYDPHVNMLRGTTQAMAFFGNAGVSARAG